MQSSPPIIILRMYIRLIGNKIRHYAQVAMQRGFVKRSLH
jgi:hypothetical protein